MKLAILASIFGAAAAFAPATTGGAHSTTALNAEKSTALPFMPYPENLKGYVGDVGFDPLGISEYVPMDYLREAELKHGRICMLAWTGYIAVDMGLRVYPIPEAYQGLTAATAHDPLVKAGAMGQIFLWIGLLEMVSWIGVSQMLQGSGRAPGDFGWGLQYLEGKSDDEIEKIKLQELKHGRLAMMAFSGVVTQSVLYDKGFPYV
uniref:Plastid light harvesting protein n=1 Tax=Helicotheca tamesis TaxID=374047 RepID=A0A7S2E173_9STRA|mmetsp:Transcript_11431/g.15837  ORF Transcript_11431/g.15837 Transcript_11431/m.15837 type:complete len:205 (+) Transcript_11431:112-726(+)|eukprot:CAMPEP_0185726532 /NCGR_PEP_ID=MMETSP1171-20130828/2487_1 /TAXON_ID=374046 /ORGANISM="Helicotheca tamensis, Strain CCMP826" /LENGTH=204 /DNA_ID=CAMNT_0028394911 /DNA_START=99 /DNA_END=713 /DNA_ORIENTATION=-